MQDNNKTGLDVGKQINQQLRQIEKAMENIRIIMEVAGISEPDELQPYRDMLVDGAAYKTPNGHTLYARLYEDDCNCQWELFTETQSRVDVHGLSRDGRVYYDGEDTDYTAADLVMIDPDAPRGAMVVTLSQEVYSPVVTLSQEVVIDLARFQDGVDYCHVGKDVYEGWHYGPYTARKVGDGFELVWNKPGMDTNGKVAFYVYENGIFDTAGDVTAWNANAFMTVAAIDAIDFSRIPF